MIDPLERWKQYGDKPDYAGLLTFGTLPYTQDPAELVGVDVAIVGAPTDDLVSDRPGTRFGPRAIRAASCPPGPHLEAKVDAMAVLKMVDYGDAPVLPADPVRSHDAIERTVGEVVAAGAIPVVLGGDHSIAEPDIRACAAGRGPIGLVHFDTHADTGTEVFGVEISHGTPMYRLVEAGVVDPRRYVQIGLATGRARRSSPGRRSAGSRASSCMTCGSSGSRRSSGRRPARLAKGRFSSRSTSTFSTPRSRRAPARQSPAEWRPATSSGPAGRSHRS